MTFFVRHIRSIPGLFLILIIVVLTCTTSSWAEFSQKQKQPVKTVSVLHCDYPPVSFWDKNTNRPSGFFVDIMESVAKRAGLQVNYICKNGWPEMINAIESGEADLGVLLKSKEREKSLLFSSPIDVTYLSFFARSQSSVDADRVPSGYTVGVIKGSMSYEQLKDRPGVSLHVDGSYKEGLFDLLAGEISVFAGEESMILKNAREARLEEHIKKVGKPFVERERSFAVKKDNVQLLELLNKILPDFVGSPEYQSIYLKWYGTPAPYWTNKRIFAASGVFLFIVVCGMALWRYLSISRINKELISNITERKQVEESMRQAEARLSRAQAIAHVGDWEWDIATNAVHWSDELYRIYGFEPRSVAPDYGLVLAQMHPASKEKFLAAIDAALKHDRHFEMDYRFYRKEGSEALLHTVGRVIRDATGAPAHMVGIVQDITERKKTENDLELFKNLLNRANEAIFVNDSQTGRFIDVNDRACVSLGYDRAELLKLGVMDIETTLPDDFVWQKHMAEVRRHDSLLLEGILKRKDGTTFPVETSVSLVALDSREYMIAVVRDITDRKEAEEKIRESEHFIRSILDTVDEGFIIIDRDFRILTANRAYCAQLGEVCDEIIGRHCYEISHKTSRPCYEEGEECAVRQVFATGQPHAAIHKHMDHDGHLLFVETKGYPIKDASGNVTSVIETIHNITEKHLLEEERLKTQKLESIGTLAGGIAHDFNNLLQGIFGYIYMAKVNFDQKEKALAMLEQAEMALHQSVSLTTQLLTFSKGGKPVKKRISLLPVIENAMKFALSGSRSGCQLDIETGLWQVDADGGQLGQVIQNIVLNADQAMPEGGTIMIAAKNVLSPNKELPHLLREGKYVDISVQDSGIGISEQYVQKIFDPYFTTKEKGSGLGLATSYSIIRNHGGLITVTSQRDKGTTFHIYLPAIGVGKEFKETPSVTSVVRKGKILVMDDEELVRSIVGELIRALGHEGDFAEHGETAIKKYQAAMKSGKPFDIVILDLTIRGGMGGKETIRQLLAIDPGVRAIVSSGYSDDAAVADYQKYGFIARLTKPYKLEDLRDSLNALLSA